MKQNDTSPEYRAFLSRLVGTVISPMILDGYTATLTMVNTATGTVKIDEQPCVIEDSENGIVRYDWQTGDTDTVGNYKIVIKLTNIATPSLITTFPSEGYDYLSIEKNL